DPEALNGEYFSDLAALLARPDTLPASLRNTLLVLEHAATPENDWKVQDAIHRRIPRVLVSRTCPLDRVLDLWFLVPDELSQFNSAIEISNAEMQREHSLSPSEGERGSRITHHASLLLAAIRQIFTQTAATRISSKQLVEALRAIPLSASGGEGQGEVVRYSQLTQATLA